MPSDITITSNLLYQGALIFALIDLVYVPVLIWRIDQTTFHRLKWPLVMAAALVWYGIWSWAIGNFWETVYSYVFPGWAHIWVPRIALVVAGAVGLGLWTLAIRLKRHTVVAFCLMGGILGSLTHIRAVQLGIVTKPPMLRGASPLAAVVIAFFEFMFYWCTILVAAKIMDWARNRFGKSA